MTTLTDRTPEIAPHEPYRKTAMTFLATGRTAASVRAHAAEPAKVLRVALSARITFAAAREQMLAIADAIEMVEARGLTGEQCYYLMFLDRKYGPYPGPASLSAA